MSLIYDVISYRRLLYGLVLSQTESFFWNLVLETNLSSKRLFLGNKLFRTIKRAQLKLDFFKLKELLYHNWLRHTIHSLQSKTSWEYNNEMDILYVAYTLYDIICSISWNWSCKLKAATGSGTGPRPGTFLVDGDFYFTKFWFSLSENQQFVYFCINRKWLRENQWQKCQIISVICNYLRVLLL